MCIFPCGLRKSKAVAAMADHKPLYEWSLNEAIRNDERDLWRDSFKENCECARAIEDAISAGYNLETYCLEDRTDEIIKKYGFDRVNWVLANTVREKMADGRFSYKNKTWAKSIHIPQDDDRRRFAVKSHPGLTDLFVNQVRRAWQKLGLFDRSHCISEQSGEINYTGKVLVLDPSILKDEYKTPEDQLFFAKSGFGCSPNSRGRKVFGEFLKDGEKTHYYRSDFLGAIKEEHLPDWAREKLDTIMGHEQQENETEGMTMGGM